MKKLLIFLCASLMATMVLAEFPDEWDGSIYTNTSGDDATNGNYYVPKFVIDIALTNTPQTRIYSDDEMEIVTTNNFHLRPGGDGLIETIDDFTVIVGGGYTPFELKGGGDQSTFSTKNAALYYAGVEAWTRSNEVATTEGNLTIGASTAVKIIAPTTIASNLVVTGTTQGYDAAATNQYPTLAQVQADTNTLQGNINGKVATTTFDSATNAIGTNIEAKVATTTFNTVTNAIGTNIEAKVSTATHNADTNTLHGEIAGAQVTNSLAHESFTMIGATNGMTVSFFPKTNCTLRRVSTFMEMGPGPVSYQAEYFSVWSNQTAAVCASQLQATAVGTDTTSFYTTSLGAYSRFRLIVTNCTWVQTNVWSGFIEVSYP